MQEQFEQQAREIAGLQQQLRRAGAAEMALRNELAKVREDEPEAQEIRAVLNHWKRRLGHPKAKCPLTGKRAKVVRAALRSHSLAELLEAVDGLALRPFAGPHGRHAILKPGDRRYDDVEHALGDEKRIQEHREFWARAQASSIEQRLQAWQSVAAVEQRYFDLYFELVGRDGVPEQQALRLAA